MLSELISDLQEVGDQPRPVLSTETVVHGPPAALKPCHELWLRDDEESDLHCKWIITQKRLRGEEYTSVIGKRDYGLRSGQRKRSPHMWPRTRKDKKRPIALHRWIATCVWGSAPTKKHDAAHICGNARCIAAAHIRWQLPIKNQRDERIHHHTHNHISKTSAKRFALDEWPTFPCALQDELSV